MLYKIYLIYATYYKGVMNGRDEISNRGHLYGQTGDDCNGSSMRYVRGERMIYTRARF